MIKNKIVMLFLILAFSLQYTYADTKLEEVNSPKDIMYRFGTTDTPEKKVDTSQQIDLRVEDIEIKPTISTKTDSAVGKTYADLSIKSMAMEVSKSLEMDYDDMLADLSLLWQGAATNSDTIKFAIYKLSNPEKDKPDESAVKKVLSTIAGMSTFLGAGSGNPMLASAALIGGNTLGIMSQDNKALNYKYTQVTDADMIILVRKVDELQQKVVDSYYDYMTAKKLYDMTTAQAKQCEINYRKAQNLSKEVVLITDTFYREALDEQVKARGSFFEKRSQLEQLVGKDIFNQFEKNVDVRTK
jgi:hypothetical protein